MVSVCVNLRVEQYAHIERNSTWDQSYIISAGIPAVQSFWTILIALPMDIWPTLTTSRSHELTEIWRKSENKRDNSNRQTTF